MCIATITADGQITIPSEIRRQLGMSRGGLVHLECQAGTLVIYETDFIDGQ